METKKFFSFFKATMMVAAMLMSASFLTACSDDDDDDLAIQDVPEVVRKAFTSEYADASQVTWERNGLYYVADCVYNTYDSEMWYEANGTWVMTVVEYDLDMSLTPTAVQNAFSASEYAQGTVDDVTYYKRTSDEVYQIETVLTANGEDKEYTLFYSSDGTLVNSILNFKGSVYPYTVIADLK